MTTDSRRADELFEEAIQHAIKEGYWHQTPAAESIAKRGIKAIEEKDAKEAAAAEALAEEARRAAELVEWPHWGNYRLVLGEGDNTQVVYFRRKPTYAEKKAFCAAAGVSPESVDTEERL